MVWTQTSFPRVAGLCWTMCFLFWESLQAFPTWTAVINTAQPVSSGNMTSYSLFLLLNTARERDISTSFSSSSSLSFPVFQKSKVVCVMLSPPALLSGMSQMWSQLPGAGAQIDPMSRGLSSFDFTNIVKEHSSVSPKRTRSAHHMVQHAVPNIHTVDKPVKVHIAP